MTFVRHIPLYSPIDNHPILIYIAAMPRILGETPDPFAQKMAERIIENVRKQPYKDAHAQQIIEYWIRQASGISKDQSKEIGMLWLTKILGVDEKSAELFSSDDWESKEYLDVYQKIGYLHAGSRTFKPDAEAFWKGVHDAVPEMVKDDDLGYLINTDTGDDGDGAWAAWAMIEAIDQVKPMQGFLTTHLVSNALLYK